MKRVTDPADPRRCKGAAPDGQCMNEACHGSEYCSAHGGRSNEEATKTRLYLLNNARDRTRLAQFAEHEELKSLREEIALARMLIEHRFNMIKTDAEMLAAAAPINTLLLTLERLVKSAHTIDQSLGALLNKTSVQRLGQQLCVVLIEELEGIPGYEEIIDRVTTRLVTTIQEASNMENTSNTSV